MKGRKVRVNHRSRRVRKESRTNPIWGSKDRGDGEDHDRYWTCWNCGFTCDVERDELGDSESTARINHQQDTLTDEYAETTGYCYGANGQTQTLCEANDGTWTTYRYWPDGGSGCPFCHSPNWRGDYP